MNYLTIGKLTNLQKRFILFLGGCIPVRIALAYLSKIASPTQLKFLVLSHYFPLLDFYLYISYN